IKVLEKNNTCGWFSIRCGGSKGHGIGIVNAGLDRRRKPNVKLLDRIRVEIATQQSFSDVFATKTGLIERTLFHYVAGNRPRYFVSTKMSIYSTPPPPSLSLRRASRTSLNAGSSGVGSKNIF